MRSLFSIALFVCASCTGGPSVTDDDAEQPAPLVCVIVTPDELARVRDASLPQA